MNPLIDRRIVVAGAGALGAATALSLARAGARVLLADPAALGDNASGVAAGMLAPALECALDDLDADRFALFKAARDAWPALLDEIAAGGALDRSGALWLGEAEQLPERLARLQALGARAEIVTAAQAEALAPGLRAQTGGLFTPDDWRIDPRAMLRAMRDAFLGAGGRIAAASVIEARPGRVRLDSGEVHAADWTVLAAGHPAAAALALAPELKWLSPIKGQILRFGPQGEGQGPVAHGAVVRGDAVYVAPSRGGASAGATMEPGLTDRRTDPETVARLRAAAAALFPALAAAPVQALAAVRATTPDGLPLVGPSAAPGVLLLAGARRNGWLLAPMAAGLIAAYAAGDAPEGGAPFRPDRFG